MSTASDRPIGLIGLGLLGSAIADRLLKAGLSVTGYDVQQDATTRFRQAGGQVANSARDVAAGCRCVILSLPNSDIVDQVLDEIASELKPGSVIIDTTTGDPQRTRRSATALSSRQVELVDATVLGSSAVTRAGESVLMVGASAEALETCGEVLGAISGQIHHVGPVGSGQEMKLVANLVLGLNRAVLAEGLHFAGTLGLDLNRVLDVLKSGAAYSTVMDAKGHKMITGDFEPQARLSQHLKDVRLILQHAQDAGTQLPLSQLHQQLLQSVETGGGGNLDNSAVIRAW